MIVVLTGGSGGAKLAQGLARVLPPRELTCVVNTGDDLTWWGLHVSPDLDSITYALAGMLSAERGWGIEGDTFHCLAQMKRLGAPAWFQLGDRDLATHLLRTELLASGATLTEATRQITQAFGVQASVLPMTDARVETRVLTPDGELNFQEFFVRERWQVPVTGVRFDGTEWAAAALGVVEAIMTAEAIVIAPSNPVTSIGPILSVPGIRAALRRTLAPIAAVSPIVGGAAVSGPAGELMRAQRLPVSPAGVAQAYADFLDVLVMDERDAGASVDIPAIEVRVANTIMKTMADTAQLARTVLGFIREHALKTAS